MLFLTGCAPQSISTLQLTPTSLSSAASEAQQVLTKYFDLLNSKQYAEADALYGGDFEQLKVFSADVDPSDHARLWSNACELAGLRCLRVRTATLLDQATNTYRFQVEFNNPDGSLFILGPCCGSNETEIPPVSHFEITVVKNAEGKLLVTNLPPYVP
jgi:hypothetical protein